MTDSPIVRALVTPLILVVAFFTIARACTQSIVRGRVAEVTAQQQAEAQKAAPAPSAPRRAYGEIEYPPGLNAERIGYLVSIETKFSEPLTMEVPKTGYGGESLQRLGYLKVEDDRNVLTREGLMNLTVSRDTETSWTFTIAKRLFVDVSGVQAIAGTDDYRVTISWQWDASPVAKQLGVSDSRNGAVAELRSNAGSWVFVRWVSSIDTGHRYR